MRNNRLRIFLALFWFAWTAIIIPGHTRGAISATGSSCCHPSGKDKNTNTKNPANCAVCQLAAHLMPAVALPMHRPSDELVEVISILPTARPILPNLSPCFLSRGPPCLL